MTYNRRDWLIAGLLSLFETRGDGSLEHAGTVLCADGTKK